MNRESVRLLVSVEALLDSIAQLSLEDKVSLRESLNEQIEAAASKPGQRARGKYAHVATSSDTFARRKREEIALEGERR